MSQFCDTRFTHIKTDQLERQISLALSNIEGEETCFFYNVTRVLDSVRERRIFALQEFACRVRLGSSENPACVYALCTHIPAPLNITVRLCNVINAASDRNTRRLRIVALPFGCQLANAAYMPDIFSYV